MGRTRTATSMRCCSSQRGCGAERSSSQLLSIGCDLGPPGFTGEDSMLPVQLGNKAVVMGEQASYFSSDRAPLFLLANHCLDCPHMRKAAQRLLPQSTAQPPPRLAPNTCPYLPACLPAD